MGGMAIFTNHSSNPNFELQKWEFDRLPSMCFFAIKNIKEGDELTFDYNWECDKTKKRQNVSVGQRNVEVY